MKKVSEIKPLIKGICSSELTQEAIIKVLVECGVLEQDKEIEIRVGDVWEVVEGNAWDAYMIITSVRECYVKFYSLYTKKAPCFDNGQTKSGFLENSKLLWRAE